MSNILSHELSMFLKLSFERCQNCLDADDVLDYDRLFKKILDKLNE